MVLLIIIHHKHQGLLTIIDPDFVFPYHTNYIDIESQLWHTEYVRSLLIDLKQDIKKELSRTNRSPNGMCQITTMLHQLDHFNI